MAGLARGELNRLIRIERPVPKTGLTSAGSGTWTVVEEEVWASIKDVLPSRAEKMADGINIATRPARVRMDFRDDLTAAMRFIDVTSGSDGRVMQIIAGPATIGNDDGVELMVEDFSVSGNAA